jgi:hypothetical protein
MPRYFFHAIDNEGTEFPNLRYARIDAIRLAGAILHNEDDTFWDGDGPEWHMNVTDTLGKSALKLRLSTDDQGIAPVEDQGIKAPTKQGGRL